MPTISPNMSLVIPSTGVTPGPDFANEVNSSLATIDQHDHSPGYGVQITPAGLNINTDLPILANNLTLARSVRFSGLSSTGDLSASDNGSIEKIGVDLYYRDGNGNNIRLTQSGSIAGTSGSITNLVSPASVTYVSGTPAFVFQSDVNTAANIDGGSYVLRNITANSKGITLNPPSALANNYSITLPAALPASVKFLTIDNSGNIGDTIYIDSSTIVVSSNVMMVPANGITSNEIANGSIIINKLGGSSADGISLTVSGGVMKLINAGRVQGGNFTISTGTTAFAYPITAPSLTSQTGRVRVTIAPRTDDGDSYFFIQSLGTTSTLQVKLEIYQGGSSVRSLIYAMNLAVTSNASYQIPVGQSFEIDAPIGTPLGYNLLATVTSNATGGKSTIVNASLYLEDVTY